MEATANPYWPLFDLRVRTPRIEMRPPTDADLPALIDVALGGIHDPATMPFQLPWTDAPPAELQRSSLQWWWRQRADWRPEAWSLCFAIVLDGRPIGVQDMNGRDFARKRTVETGSWLGLPYQGQGIGKEMRAAALHFAFAGLGAQWAVTAAWEDNASSLGVTRSLGYEPNGESVELRRGEPGVQLHFRLSRAVWEQRRRDDITVEGLDRCLDLFGLG
jgi:RimJ/RimL family protein N-acetyltransferase